MTNTFPDYLNPSEYGLYVAYEAENSFNVMMHNIGISELHSFEEGGVAVLEAASSVERGRKKDKIIGWFKELWKKIVSAYETVLDFIKKHIDEIKRRAANSKKNKVIDARNYLIKNNKGDTELGELKYNIKSFKELAAGRGKIWDAIDAVDKGMRDASATATRQEVSAITQAREEAEDVLKAFNSKIGISDDNPTGEAINKYIKEYTAYEKPVKVTAKYFADNFDDIWSYGMEYSKIASDIKGALKKSQNSIEYSIKIVENVFKADTKDGGDKDVASKAVSAIAVPMKDAKMRLVGINNAIMSELRTCHSDCARIITKVSTTKIKGAVGESASVVPSSFQTELASLFQF